MTHRFKLKQVYAYLVLLMAVIVLVIGAVSTYQGIVDLLLPAEQSYYQDSYKLRPDSNSNLQPSILTPEIIESENKKLQESYIEMERNQALRNLIQGSVTITLSIILILTHRSIAAN